MGHRRGDTIEDEMETKIRTTNLDKETLDQKQFVSTTWTGTARTALGVDSHTTLQKKIAAKEKEQS